MVETRDYNKLDQDLYIELNKAREEPKSLIPYLKKMEKNFNEKIFKDSKTGVETLTKEGIFAIKEAITYLSKLKQKKPLKKNLKIQKAAKTLTNYFKETSKSGHQKGQYSLQNRFRKNLKKKGKGTIGENISYENSEALKILINFIIDDGVQKRKNRLNLFNNNYTQIGISSNFHKEFGICTVFNFFGVLKNNENLCKHKYKIPKKEWPKGYKNMEEKNFVKNVNGNKTITIIYNFIMFDGSKIQKRKIVKEKMNN